ncbi:CsbD family protein [Reyranella sp.]|uniref:CsbD family protein n=1 Tax=Reyranella sp. TaxID=1929291 RepID=UPI003BA89392
MRSIATVAACAAIAVVSLPFVAVAQTTSQTTTTQNDAQTMWEKVKGSWSQTKGAVKEQWGELTDDDLLAIEGRRDQLVGKIQTRYGISREAAEAQVGAWEKGRLKNM